MAKLIIRWSDEAIQDLRLVFLDLQKRNSKEIALKIRTELFRAPKSIIFPEQFQVDEYFPRFRRIVVRNYKVLYYENEGTINIAGIFNSYQDTSKMKI